LTEPLHIAAASIGLPTQQREAAPHRERLVDRTPAVYPSATRTERL